MALPFLCSVVAAGVSPAAVLPAGMAFAVALPVVGAQHVRQKDQLARQQIHHSLVRAAGHAAVQLDACLDYIFPGYQPFDGAVCENILIEGNTFENVFAG